MAVASSFDKMDAAESYRSQMTASTVHPSNLTKCSKGGEARDLGRRMQGLMSFRSELEKAFATALKILEVEDPDTAAACVEVRNKGRKVILSFSGVLLTLSLTPTLLEGFEKGAANGDHSAAVGRLDSAKTWLRKLRGEISTLTSDYIELGDHVFYLAQCVDAVCDVAVSAASTSPRESWRKARQLALQEALDQLQTAARMLHEPWDCFSSMFEVAQNLVVACQRAQSLRDSLIMGSPAGRPDLARMYAEFCDSLRDMSDSM